MTTETQQEFGVGCHVHHNQLLELVVGYSKRVAYIRTQKPPEERETRLGVFFIFPDERLPEAVRLAVVAVREAWAKLAALSYDYQAKLLDADDLVKRTLECDAYLAKLKLLDAAIAEHMPALVALHNKLCVKCPWDEAQQTIFPKKETP